jgi:hypothetical protein
MKNLKLESRSLLFRACFSWICYVFGNNDDDAGWKMGSGKIQVTSHISINPECTVSRRVVINPRSDSSESCFHVLNPRVNSLAKKKSQQETPCYLPLFWYGPSKWKLWEKSWIFLAAEGSILEPNISGSVRNLFGVYILVRKVFKSAFCPQL